MKDGVTLSQARAEMTTIGQALAQEIPEARQTGILVTPLHERIVGDTRAPLVALFGAVLAVLLIACANIAGLLLARGAAREREVALRKALGATSGRIVRQLLTESVILGGLGVVGGLLLAGWLLDVLVTNAPPETPGWIAYGLMAWSWPLRLVSASLRLSRSAWLPPCSPPSVKWHPS
jgi:putative ABC transport system permease protein